MRLLHTSRYTVEEFLPNKVAEYAILSHTWGDGEITLRDIESDAWRHKQAADKLIGICRLAAEEGFKYIWMDTCCIDKASSAELSEAINSMFRWYERAKICYVYLEDVELEHPDRVLTELTGTMDTAQCLAVRQSRWFTRGWTLQELLANYRVHFYDRKFNLIGRKMQLDEVLSRITNIASLHLSSPGNASVAQKMSWAAGRETSRPEDRAYSLLGLLGVNMPLLYGEGGPNAFYRLQLEILARSDDESIFAWADEGGTRLTSLLARSPNAFLGSARFIHSNFRYMPHVDPDRPPYAMTNKGLRFEPLLTEPLLTDFRYEEDKVEDSLERLESARFRADIWLMPLNCDVEGSSDCVCILMRRMSPILYARLGWALCICSGSEIEQRCRTSERETIFVKQF